MVVGFDGDGVRAFACFVGNGEDLASHQLGIFHIGIFSLDVFKLTSEEDRRAFGVLDGFFAVAVLEEFGVDGEGAEFGVLDDFRHVGSPLLD